MKIFLLGIALGAPVFAGCTCEAGRMLEPGMVRYGTNSDRETIVKVETDTSSSRCSAVWVVATEIHPSGNPYRFHLERVKLHTRRMDGCGRSPGEFVRQNKTYQFVFDAHSTSIREIRPVARAGADAAAESNHNLWSAIVVDRSGSRRRRGAAHLDPTRELNRTAWVLARRRIRGYFVGRVEDAGQNEKLVALNKTRVIAAGQLGQIEAVGERSIIVRFYEGSRAEAFGGEREALRRWYAGIGGPYSEVKDDLYTAIRAEILEVSIGDVIEVNDYLDQRNADGT